MDLTNIVGRCMRCRENKQMKDAKMITFKMKNGNERPAITGVCPVCECKMFKIISKKDAGI